MYGRIHRRIGRCQVDDMEEPEGRMLIFYQRNSVLQGQIRSVAAIDRYQNVFVHCRCSSDVQNMLLDQTSLSLDLDQRFGVGQAYSCCYVSSHRARERAKKCRAHAEQCRAWRKAKLRKKNFSRWLHSGKA